MAVALKEALRRLAKAVIVVTCEHESVRFAMAATAVSELSMEPPSMLVCVNCSASIYSPLNAGVDFCINILHESHSNISMACGGAAKGEARFSQGRWAAASRNTYRLEDAQASLVCASERSMRYGSHGIFIGRVVEVRCVGSVEPLIYVNGSYASLVTGEIRQFPAV